MDYGTRSSIGGIVGVQSGAIGGQMDPPSDKPPVQIIIEAVDVNWQGLVQSLSSLEKRLCIVLRPATPSPAEGQPQANGTSNSPMVQVWREHLRRVELLAAQIEDIHRRLEI